MTEKILVALKQDIKSLKLIPARGGCFEVWIDKKRIYSKLATGEFPDETAIVEEIKGKA